MEQTQAYKYDVSFAPINTPRPRQDGRHFSDYIFLNENV